MDPSGRFAAFSLSDGTLLLRQMPSGTEVARLQMDHPAGRYCFNAAGDQLASVHVADRHGTVKGAPSAVRGLRLGSDRRRPLARGRADSDAGGLRMLRLGQAVLRGGGRPDAPAVRLIELKSKTAVLTVPLPREMQKRAAVALSPDGKFFVVETVEPTEPSISVLDVWDWAAGRRVQRLEPRVSGVSPIIFSRDGKYFCCVSDENVVIYKMDGFQRVSEFREWSRLGSRPAFAPDSDVIAVPIWQQRRIRLWDFLRNQDVAVLEEPSYAGGVRFAPDGSFLLTIGPRHARLYRLDLSAEVLRLSGHVGGVPGVCFNPDGSRLASAGKDRTVRVWEAATGHVVWEPKTCLDRANV